LFAFAIGKAHATGVSGGILIEINRVFTFKRIVTIIIEKAFTYRPGDGNVGYYLHEVEWLRS
jgi:hypothetical protein